MANPFGEDDVDFDIAKMLSAAHTNALAILDDPWTPCKRY